jgi:hypothetical protein
VITRVPYETKSSGARPAWVAAALSQACDLITTNGLAYTEWWMPVSDNVRDCPIDPVAAIAVAVCDSLHGLRSDDLAMHAGCKWCAIISAAIVAFAGHILDTELLDDPPSGGMSPYEAMQLIIAWIEGDRPPVSVVAEALAQTARNVEAAAS